jgi:hypothetical protein
MAMDEDDLPPHPTKPDTGFSGALGRTAGNFVWIAIVFALAGGLLYLATRWL